MAVSKQPKGAEKRKKKRKSRTLVEVSSSESDSDTPPQSSKKPNGVSATAVEPSQNGDISMTDVHDAPSSSPSPAPAPANARAQQESAEEFSSIYLRKVTTELADDLDKVRDAQDFRASSLPMLVHALRQGASIYSTEQQRRVANAMG
ncbi:hypothetical protein N0V90_010186 [Kalmusia sp. IMI 367209]|nr:hypothetical protein N0V90_010186 [Kalmusia sp. IMI 367209]